MNQMSHHSGRAALPAIIVAALIFSCPPVAAETLPALLQRIAAVNRKTRTLEAHFTQVKHLALFQTAVTTKGLMRFRKPGDLRWETLSPDESVLVLSRGKAELRLPGEKPRALPLDQGGALSLLMDQVLVWLGVKAPTNLTAQYDVTLSKTKGSIQLLLKPKVAALKKRISSLSFVLDPELSLQKIKVKQKDGDRMEITFDTMRRNLALPRHSFN